MILQNRCSVWDFRAERVFIHYGTVLLLEDGRCDPSSKPLSAGKSLSGGVNSHGSSTSHPPMLTPRTLSLAQSKPTLRFESGVLGGVSFRCSEDAQGSYPETEVKSTRTGRAVVNNMLKLSRV